MRFRNRANSFHAWIIVKHHTAAAVDLNVDESRQQHVSVQVAMGNACNARIIGGDQRDNPVGLNEDYPAGHQAFVAQDPRVD